jgi:cytoskeletal protein CcmA (bactofilin family)
MSFFGNRRQAEPAPPPPAVERTQQAPKPAPAPPPAPVGFETVLGANSELEGTLRSNANVRLDGTFTGTLEITGNVLVGETAKINADINARNVSIAGAVRGNVSGKKVQILRTGRIWGDIRATALTTEEGAFIDGKITMVSHEAAQPPAPEPPPSEPAFLSEVSDAVVETAPDSEANTEVQPAAPETPEISTPPDGEA